MDELYLARAEPASIGLSAIGAQLLPVSLTDERGLHLRLGEGGETVAAPVGPGSYNFGRHRVMACLWKFGESVDVELRPCTVALDGERAFTLMPGQRAEVRLSDKGPRVVQVEETLRVAAIDGGIQDIGDIGVVRMKV